jgi:secretion/DNA translocation related TadE-like protein
VLSCSGLVAGLAFAALVSASAVLARHQAENSADLAAISGAEQIGRAGQPCRIAAEIAAANSTTLTSCQVQLAVDGRSGVVSVTVSKTVRLAGVGSRSVTAVARAAREPSA